MTSALRLGWAVSATSRPLYPRERPGTHCTGGWVGLRAGLDGCGKSRSHRDPIPGPSSPQRLFIRCFSLLLFSSSALYFTSFNFPLILLVLSFFAVSYFAFSHSYSLHVLHDILSFFFHKCPDLHQPIFCVSRWHAVVSVLTIFSPVPCNDLRLGRKHITAKTFWDILEGGVCIFTTEQRPCKRNK